MIKGLYPETFKLDRLAHCMMIYGWDNVDSSSFQHYIEELFNLFDMSPDQATGSNQTINTHGSYNRVKKKLYTLVNMENDNDRFDFRVRASNPKFEAGFFPCNLEFVANKSNIHPKQAQIAVKDGVVNSCSTMIDKVLNITLQEFGAFCGGCWSFPAEFGPAEYLSSVGSLPQGVKWGSNRYYVQRITRWKNNIWRNGYAPAKGYFREIYPINFLFQTHLDMPFRNNNLSDYIERHGSLTALDTSKKMFRWDLTDEELMGVRTDLEDSGLVLSADIKPLAIN